MVREIHGLIASASMVALLLLLAACDDEPTQDEANEQFCDDVGVFAAALGDLRDVDQQTRPSSEFEDARENVRTAYDNMIASAEQVRDVTPRRPSGGKREPASSGRRHRR